MAARISPRGKFVGVFLLTLVIGYVVIAYKPVNDNVIEPYTAVLASGTGAILNLMGQNVTVSNTLVSGPGFAMNIYNGCNAIEAMLILLAAIVAYPASMRARGIGLLGGMLLIQALNFVRLVSLYLIGRYWPAAFETAHVTVWQVVIILFALAIFVYWSRRFAPQLEHAT